jgi:hypothetical protein
MKPCPGVAGFMFPSSGSSSRSCRERDLVTKRRVRGKQESLKFKRNPKPQFVHAALEGLPAWHGGLSAAVAPWTGICRVAGIRHATAVAFGNASADCFSNHSGSRENSGVIVEIDVRVEITVT